MSRFRFRILELRDSTPQEWLRVWDGRYQEHDEKEYRDLIGKHESLSAEDFVRIGKWKDGAKTPRLWKPNVAHVAYPIWMEAVQKLPKCPEESDVEAFLNYWSGRMYTDKFEKGGRVVEKPFGVPRATTLLHFISGGHFPMIDSRVRRAIARLRNDQAPKNTVRWYLDSFRPLFSELAALCKTEGDPRTLDRALFSYGSKALSSEKFSFSN
ncbi:MAG: hypothetical protein WAU82_17515 [Candidatus Binatus sp.]|uniref:hypothetical protein n=1 Tax=Candidatus Binatus sp. TaxID=2811406 RepID=UPI003BB1AC7D